MEERKTHIQRPPDRALPDLAGQVIAGYRIQRLIGIGGMGRVYRALDTQLGRDVAIKFVSTAVLDDEKLLARFSREIQLLETISHPNVAHIYGQGQHEGVPYFVMEYIQGTSLARMLKDGTKLPGKRILDLLIEAAEGLQAVYREGIVHRDIKPSNLMVDATGHIKVVDFGVARRIGDETGLTAKRAILGTPRFMSPEQAVGGETDHRSDIYSLGVTFYTLFAGRAPFECDDPAELRRLHVAEEPPRLKERVPRIPAAIDAVVHRMMAKKPEDRYGTYTALIEDLRHARLGARPAPPPTPSATQRATENTEQLSRAAVDLWSKRPQWFPLAVVGVLLLVVLATVTFNRPEGGGFEVAPAPAEEPEPFKDPLGVATALRDALYTRSLANLRRVATNIDSYRAENGFVPDRLQDLVAEYGVPGPALIDGWGRKLRYEHVRNGYRLSSLGFDGHPSDDDIVVQDGVLTEPDPERPTRPRRR